ncbi:hypothetical protein [Frigidibacter sp. MR17.24]|uniref:COG3904 family protein n=1 Tax=Frigidibacter sp. MR17.24 TaxID=3127345 RepID=UPI003012C560
MTALPHPAQAHSAQAHSAQARPARGWTATRVLRLMLGLQVALAGMIVAGDVMTAHPGLIPGRDNAPATEVPVRPGDQTRRFSPRTLPTDRPAGPGFPRRDAVPSRLSFERATIGGIADTLLVTGAIEPGDADRFLRELEGWAAPPAQVALHSPGGSVADALRIGQAIRDAGLPTAMAAGAACFSACPYILAGGTERRVDRDARVGVHQHYFGENSLLPAFTAVSDVQAGQAQVMDYLHRMGIDPMVMSKALATPPDDIYILLPDELTDWRVATALVGDPGGADG